MCFDRVGGVECITLHIHPVNDEHEYCYHQRTCFKNIVAEEINEWYRIKRSVKHKPSFFVVEQPLMNACIHEHPGETIKTGEENVWLHLVQPHSIHPFVYRQQVKDEGEV